MTTERERPVLEYRHVLRGEDRMKMTARIYVLRVEKRMRWKEISDITGVPLAKACRMLNQYDITDYKQYLEEARND